MSFNVTYDDFRDKYWTYQILQDYFEGDLFHINALERVQKFSLRMGYKAWDEEYDN